MLAETIALLLMVQGTPSNGTNAGRDDPDQVICRRSEPVLGSRVARQRICRTRAQWQAFEEDRHQLRRDLQNSTKDPSIDQ